ncbi:MAG TPA: helix-turn-helix transcriptional regulator [Allosphingosinicella sp.]|jgi:transcriptional regulator with XRE-family HTH domain
MLPAMKGIGDFAPRFRLALQAIGLSRGKAASLLGVDKSLVGRWAAGSVTPSEHNLVNVTTLVARSVPGFSLLDWQLDPPTFARRLGVEPTALTALQPGEGTQGLPLEYLSHARAETERRGAAYEGFWRTTRPSVIMGGRVLHDHGMIRASGGLLEVRMGGAGLIFKGCAMLSEGNLSAILYDSVGCTPLFLVFRGVPLPKATVLDGLLLFSSLDASRTPAAIPVLLERIGELSGDREKDEATCEEYCRRETFPKEGEVSETLLSHLVRDFGPTAAAAGGDLFLTASANASLSRGVSPSGELEG